MRPTYAASAMGFTPAMATAEVVKKSDRVSVLVEAEDVAKVLSAVKHISTEEQIERLSESILSAYVTLDTAQDLIKHEDVKRVQTKKEKAPTLSDASANIGLLVPK